MWSFVYMQNFLTQVVHVPQVYIVAFCMPFFNYKSVKFGYQNEFLLACSTENTLSWSNVQEPFACESWKMKTAMEWLAIISCDAHLLSLKVTTLLADILCAEAPQKWASFRKVFDYYLLNLSVWGYLKANLIQKWISLW